MGTYDPGTRPGIWIHRESGGALIDLSLTGQVRTLARHVSGFWSFISGARVVTPFAVEDDDIGSLVVVDSATLVEKYIDHDVHARSLTVLDDPAPLAWIRYAFIGQVSVGTVVGYMVVDADPERHGIWAAKPTK